MMFQLTSKLEIDVTAANELAPAVDLAVQYRMPALVIHPALINEADLHRIRRQGKFKLIVPVDWPKGEHQGMLKLRGLSTRELGMDGFEIMLSGGNSQSACRSEARTLSEFILHNINPRAEIRFVLGAQSRPESEILAMCAALQGVRTTLVRTDHQLKLQVSKANPEAHGRLAQRIGTVLGIGLKPSGNFTTARAVASCGWAQRIAVSLVQAQSILRELERQPEALREMLSREAHE